MIVRDAAPADYAEIERIHARMGLDYALPALGGPLFFVRKVADQDGSIAGACFLRIAAETYLWLPPEANPRAKMNAINALQPEVLRAAWQNGVDSIEARIPTVIERKFEKRLRLLGWTPNRDGWHPWTVTTHA